MFSWLVVSKTSKNMSQVIRNTLSDTVSGELEINTAATRVMRCKQISLLTVGTVKPSPLW